MNLKHSFLLVALWFAPVAMGQTSLMSDASDVDSLYREDQFYLGFTYNILTGSGDDISQSGFSGGFKVGFIRDWPLNKRRNIAIGTGAGWGIDTYGQNLFIGELSSGETVFEIIDEAVIDYKTNRFVTHSVEAPIQFRWRTSTPESHKFWRIYTGVRLGYSYYFHSTFVQPGNTVEQRVVPEFNRVRLGATFTFGYNTFNFHFYYSLNPFFNEDALIGGEPLNIRTLQIGLMFYIL